MDCHALYSSTYTQATRGPIMMLIAYFTIQISIEIGTNILPTSTTTKGVHVCQLSSLDVE